MGRAILSKSLIQFSPDVWGCVPSLLFDLRLNHGGGDEDNGNLLWKVPCMHCCIQCPQPCSRPPPTHASAGDSCTLAASLGQSLIGPLLLSPGYWCTQGFVCALQESVSQSCVSSGRSTMGLMATSFKRAYAIPRYPEHPSLQQSTADLYLCRRYSNTVLLMILYKVNVNTL